MKTLTPQELWLLEVAQPAQPTQQGGAWGMPVPVIVFLPLIAFLLGRSQPGATDTVHPGQPPGLRAPGDSGK